MLIVSQCGTGFFNSRYFAGAWVKSYNDKQFVLKAVFASKEAILGVYGSKDDALAALNELLKKFQNAVFDSTGSVYQIKGRD